MTPMEKFRAEQKRLGRTRREVWLTKDEAAIVMPKIRAIVAKLRKTGTSSGEPQ